MRERERNFSVGSTIFSAKSTRFNNINGAKSLLNVNANERWNSYFNNESTNQTTLLENATIIGTAIKSRLKQVRNTVSVGSSCAIFNNSNGGSVKVSSSICLTLLEAEFKVLIY